MKRHKITAIARTGTRYVFTTNAYSRADAIATVRQTRLMRKFKFRIL